MTKTKTGRSHPAKFGDPIIEAIDGALKKYAKPGCRVLDPFAGTGKAVKVLNRRGYEAVGVELEPEWAAECPETIVGDALKMPFQAGSFDVVLTSPTYGNRMADKDKRESVAGTYMKALGREASAGSSCHLQWGPEYRTFHQAAWAEVFRVSNDLFLLNVKDHIRSKKRMPVSEWHKNTCLELGFHLVDYFRIGSPGLRNGENHKARVDSEDLFVFRKGG